MSNQPTNRDDHNQLTMDDFGVEIQTVESLPGLPSAKKGTASSNRIRYKTFGELSIGDYEVFSALPEHPLWGQVKLLIDFSFADELCAHLYSPIGQRPFAPSLKLKLHLVQAMENLSDRELETRLMFDMAIKRFLDIPLSFTGFDHSTLGLDRGRVGEDLFHACFHYVLAQAKRHGLWGNAGDTWLIDSFGTVAHAARMGAYRLIKAGMLRVLQHLKRTHRSLFERVMRELDAATWFQRMPQEAGPEVVAEWFHLLTTRAYSLLSWFEHKKDLNWSQPKHQIRSQELQEDLRAILTQNARPKKTDDPDQVGERYEKIPKKERPKDRIINAFQPDLRAAVKNMVWHNDKIQVVASHPSRFVLEVEPIPASERDGEALHRLISGVISHQKITPAWVSGDAAYGYGEYRSRLTAEPFDLITPLTSPGHVPGKWSKDKFRFDPENDKITCPADQTHKRKARNNTQQGFYYYFDPSTCGSCSLRTFCTDATASRSIFISDHYQLVEDAKAMNETPAGQEALRVRSNVEGKNNEFANHHEMRRPHTKSRKQLRIMAKLKGMAINIKLIVKKLGCAFEDPFVRRKRRSWGCLPVFSG